MQFLILYMDMLFLFGAFGIFIHSLCKCNLLFLRHYVSFFTARISVLVSFHYYFLFIAKILFPGVFPLRFPLSLQFLFWYIVALFFFIFTTLLLFPFIFRYSCTAFFHYWNYSLRYLLEFIFLWNRKKSPLSLSLFLSLSRL